jgi:hypothetical protein
MGWEEGMRDTVKVSTVELNGRPGKRNMHEASRLVIRANVALSGEWRDGDGVFIEDRVVQ